MDYTSVVAALQNQWSFWNIRGCMVLSLCLQLILTLVAPFRQKTSNRIVIFLVWSSYLLADTAALFVFGLISSSGCQNLGDDGSLAPPDVMALWAAFLLVHLGGPDSITAFSLEDNALWLRHLIGLVTKVSAFVYIFMKTVQGNRLLAPTVLIFAAGVVNYGERTRALYVASLDNLKTNSLDQVTVPGDLEDEKIFHQIAVGLVADVKPDLLEYNKSRGFILGYSSDQISSMINSLLNMLYELFYTKLKGATSILGILARGISYYSMQVAFVLFCLVDKHGFRGVDIAITYALFVGVSILQVANIMMLAESDFMDYSSKEMLLVALEGGLLPLIIVWALTCVQSFLPVESAIFRLLERTWSEKMGSLNLLSQCFNQCPPKGGQKLGSMWNKLIGEIHTPRERFDRTLWCSVCDDIKVKAAGPFVEARMRDLYEARGDRALEGSNCRELMNYIRCFEYEDTLLIWHIATEICINMEGHVDDGNWKRIYSKKLSEYMMYLLVRQPKLMSVFASSCQVRYRDTCDEVKKIRTECEAQNMQEFCSTILRQKASFRKSTKDKNDNTLSVLKDSCRLAQKLSMKGNRWEVIYNVWVELLSYAAGHCRVNSHARLLNEGGEFITFVWILMALCGISDHFPVEGSFGEEDDEEIGQDQFPDERSCEEEYN